MLAQSAVAAIIFALFSYLLFCLAEWRKDKPEAPWYLCGASVMTLTACLCAHVLAGRQIAGYACWQPFQGGEIFVLLQAN